MSYIDFHGRPSRGDPLLPRFTRQMSEILARVAGGVQNRLELPAKNEPDSHMPMRKDREDEAFAWRSLKKKGPSPLRQRSNVARGKRLSAALAARGGRVLSDSWITSSAETTPGSSGHEDIPMLVKVAIVDASTTTRSVTEELPPRSSDSEGPRRANIPAADSESVSKRAAMPEAGPKTLALRNTMTNSSTCLRSESSMSSSMCSSSEWSDSDYDAIKARAISETCGCQSPGRPSRNPVLPPISMHLIQKATPDSNEGGKQALLWESASATTAASKEELRLAGAVAPQHPFSPKSYSSEEEAQVFQDAAMNLADLVAEFSAEDSFSSTAKDEIMEF